MNEFLSMYHGYRVVINHHLDQKAPDPTLIDKILRWNPCNDWAVRMKIVPSDKLYIVGDTIVASPSQFAALKEGGK